jgi:hypothetical protein
MRSTTNCCVIIRHMHVINSSVYTNNIFVGIKFYYMGRAVLFLEKGGARGAKFNVTYRKLIRAIRIIIFGSFSLRFRWYYDLFWVIWSLEDDLRGFSWKNPFASLLNPTRQNFYFCVFWTLSDLNRVKRTYNFTTEVFHQKEQCQRKGEARGHRRAKRGPTT